MGLPWSKYHASKIGLLFEIQAVPTSKTSFFKALVLETIKKRRLENNVRQDFVHFLMEAKQSTLKKHNASTEDLSSKPSETPEEPKNNKLEKGWTDEQVATQAVMFLNSHGGSEPFIVACSFLACELSLNPDVQVKLQEEIDNVWQKLHGHKLSYEAIFEMEYLNCVVLESLRKWPPLYQIDRQCVKNYFEVDLSIPDDEKIVIERGTAVIIPVMAIHRDPKYFPDPERFNPEPKIKCAEKKTISSKLALLQLKLLFFHLLSKFDLVQTDRTITDLDKDLHRFGSFRAIQAYLGLKPRRVLVSWVPSILQLKLRLLNQLLARKLSFISNEYSVLQGFHLRPLSFLEVTGWRIGPVIANLKFSHSGPETVSNWIDVTYYTKAPPPL
ncbi:hypothetical protein NQ317_007505 [Molorchus minor]|uniref:Cytochrome P450 n=1 Tax=Molorchus minor TaxID=1323400 RepID=A0ABQ9J6B3_9CUCU|nr:hypothetical protein NQ317_007505 [Molorchus minor]